MDYLLGLGAFLLGYVFGSIPCGLWLVQAFHGIDIRNYGSGNIGTTNVFRTVGPKTAAAVLIGDMLKGILALYITSQFTQNPTVVAVAALGALLGHNYSRRKRRSNRPGPVPVYASVRCSCWFWRLGDDCPDYPVRVVRICCRSCGCRSRRLVSEIPGALCSIRNTGLSVCYYPSQG